MNSSVLIIGSGVAGLSAARRLYEHGWRNVKILEARSYLGGRTDTLSFESSRVDLGAQWIHGQQGNPVYELAVQHDLVDHDAPTFLSSLYTFPQLKTDEENNAAFDVCQFFRKVARDKCDPNSVTCKSLGEVLNESFEIFLEESNYSPKLEDIMRSVFDFNVRFECSLNGSPSLNDVSYSLVNNYVECEGNIVTELKNKYSSFLKLLTSSIPPDCITLNSEVKRVDLSSKLDQPAVQVKTVNQDTFEADHLIVTVPLGYLKEHMCEMFHPSLPLKKQEAIKAMGFGTMNKIFLHFDEPFWNAGDMFNILWSDSSKPCQDTDSANQGSSLPPAPTDWTRGLIHFTFVYNQPHVLCAWISGEGASEMELVTLEEVGKSCHRILCTVLGDDSIPSPSKLARSTWFSNPYFRGSYSYLSVDCDKKNLRPDHIAEPVLEPRSIHQSYPFLLFAGEATHSHFFSTVHGAYESGIREADRLLEFYNATG